MTFELCIFTIGEPDICSDQFTVDYLSCSTKLYWTDEVVDGDSDAPPNSPDTGNTHPYFNLYVSDLEGETKRG